MAEREVTFRLNVTGAEQAGRGVGAAAKEVDGLAAALARMEAISKRLDALGAGPDSPHGRAAQRLLGIERKRLDDLALEQLDPDRAVRGAAREPRSIGDRIGSRLQSSALSLVGLAAGGQAIRGVADGLAELSLKATHAGDAVAILFRNITQHLPIIGPAIQGLSGLGDALSGVGAVRAAGTAFSARQVAFGAAAARAQAAELGGAGQIAGLDAAIRQAGVGGRAAEIFLGGLSPDVLAGFRPREQAGVADARTGAARQALAEALARQQAAREAVGIERGVFGRAPGELNVEFLRGRAATARAQLDAAQAREQRAQRNFDRFGFFARFGIGAETQEDLKELGFEAAGKRKVELAEAQQNLQERLEESKQAEQAHEAAITQLKERRKPLTDAEQKLAEANLAVARAQTGVAQNRADVLGAAADDIRRGGGDRRALSAFEAERQRLLDEIVRSQQEADQKFAKDVADALIKAREDLAQIVRDAVVAEKNQANAERDQKLLQAREQ